MGEDPSSWPRQCWTNEREHIRMQSKRVPQKMSKTVTLRLDDQAYAELKEAAAAERRPLSNLIETAALARIREQQFVDDAEMAEILENDLLVRRIRRGSRQAGKRQGRFVE